MTRKEKLALEPFVLNALVKDARQHMVVTNNLLQK